MEEERLIELLALELEDSAQYRDDGDLEASDDDYEG